MKEMRRFITENAGKELSRKEETHRLIKFMLIMRGLSQADLARRIGAPKQNCNDVVRGLRKTARIRRGIAEILNLDYQELWGEATNKAA